MEWRIIKERSSQIDSFLFNVWVSGAYLRLAKLLKTDNPERKPSYFLNKLKQLSMQIVVWLSVSNSWKHL